MSLTIQIDPVSLDGPRDRATTVHVRSDRCGKVCISRLPRGSELLAILSSGDSVLCSRHSHTMLIVLLRTSKPLYESRESLELSITFETFEVITKKFVANVSCIGLCPVLPRPWLDDADRIESSTATSLYSLCQCSVANAKC